MKLLFICMSNVNRSPTFERYFKSYLPEYDVRSTGIYHGYPYKLNEELLEWADKIYCMDLEQELFIKQRYPDHFYKVFTIGVSDQYEPDEPALVRLITYWVDKEWLKRKV